MFENFSKLVETLLGKQAASPEVIAFLSSFGEIPRLQLDPDDGCAYISRPDLGFSLLFKDPARIKNPLYVSLPTELPVLTSCFYYSEGHEGYRQFSGELPRGLSFSDSRGEVIQKLGQPSWKRTGTNDGRIISEKWELESLSIHVTYRKDGHGILIISLGVLQNF